MKQIVTSSRTVAAILSLTIACAGAQAGSSEARPQGSPAPATAASSETVPKSVLERYVGQYQLTPQVIATVRLSGNTLVREIMGQQTVFTPISETRFRLGGGEAEFVTDQAGRVTMVVRNGADEKRYPRVR